MTTTALTPPPATWHFTLTCPRCGARVAQRARSAGADTASHRTVTHVRAIGDCIDCAAIVFVAVAARAEPSRTLDPNPEGRYIDGDQAPGMPSEVRPPRSWNRTAA